MKVEQQLRNQLLDARRRLKEVGRLAKEWIGCYSPHEWKDECGDEECLRCMLLAVSRRRLSRKAGGK